MKQSSRLGWAGWLTLLLLAVPYLNQYGLKLLPDYPLDLASFYWAAQFAFDRHVSPYGPEVFDVVALATQKPVCPFLYPPPSLLLFWPFSRMSFDAAKVTLLVVNHACLFGTLALLLGRAGLDLPRRRAVRAYAVPFLIAYTFTLAAIVGTLKVGQVNLILLLLFCLFFVGLKRRWPAVLVAAPLAVATVLKLYPVMLLPMLLVRRQFRAAAWYGGMVVGLTAVSFAVLPAGTWRDFVDKVVPAGGYGGKVIAFQFEPGAPGASSINAFTSRIFTGNERAEPVLASPEAARVVPVALCGLVTLATWWLSWRARDRRPAGAAPAPDVPAGGPGSTPRPQTPRTEPSGLLDVEFGLYLLLTILVAPLAWEPHLTYVLPAILVVLVRLVFESRSTAARVVMAAAAIAAAWPQLLSVAPNRFYLPTLVMSHKFLALAAMWVGLAVAMYRARGPRLALAASPEPAGDRATSGAFEATSDAFDATGGGVKEPRPSGSGAVEQANSSGRPEGPAVEQVASSVEQSQAVSEQRPILLLRSLTVAAP
jgi:hypothetical protein